MKDPKPYNSLDMVTALISVLSPCETANRVGAHVAMVAAEYAQMSSLYTFLQEGPI